MTQQLRDLRSRTQDLVMAAASAPATSENKYVASLIDAWLAAVDDEDLLGIAPPQLAPLLWSAFSQIGPRRTPACQITAVPYADPDTGSGPADALLILNEDMPYLVDSIVMVLRRRKIAVNAVLNAVLAVRRSADGVVLQADRPGAAADNAPLESYVLCLLNEALPAAELAALIADIEQVASDAAVVRRDAGLIAAILTEVARQAAALGEHGQEVAAFLNWARTEGFEPFGYGYYRVVPGMRELARDIPSRIGLLQDVNHAVYGNCLANIPGDLDSLSARHDALSIVKADVQSTLHRDQQLDYIGVRDTDPHGAIIGEHCFIGLFSRAATSMPLAQMPFARGRVAQVLSLAGVRQEGFRAEKFLEILESLPRTEALEAEPQWLAEVCGSVVSLYKQPRTRIFARRDVYARHLNVLVYLPRERYSASLVQALAQRLRLSSGAADVRSQTLVADGPLARLYLIASAARYPLDLETDIRQQLLAVLDGWHNHFKRLVEAIGDDALRARVRKLAATLPPDYVAAATPQVAFDDLCQLANAAGRQGVTVRIQIGAEEREPTTIRLYSFGGVPSLSRILPALHNAGVEIDREQAYCLPAPDGGKAYVTCLKLDADSAAKLQRPLIAGVAEELFAALFNDQAEDGRLNALVIEGGLSMRQVQLVRAYMSYWRQGGSRFSVRYIADCLHKQPMAVKQLIDAFIQRFDPAIDPSGRGAAITAIAMLRGALPAIDHADTEEILDSMADLIMATLRTTYFQPVSAADDTIILKFDSNALALLPEPRPYREIFVFSRRFEGVHLRGGPVARGGLRWSDRMEDYRTEVLGLVKAQMVKNAVIVPAGAKGGFVCKMMPKDAGREAIAAEGEAVYRLFIKALLDITDNRVRGQIVAPASVVRYDEDDPYLVVAADKGTATFSDIANAIAVERGFWLGDAFASGGSNGYDHKKLGITAKGAWEAVKRHFYEMDHDLRSTPITMVGIGDMSGDVFGNGVLLSRQLKLVAAFDHRHIFIDPTPDVAASFAERSRLFALPRSSWDDYDKKLISAGGGVWPRSVRGIELSPQAQQALGISAASVTPAELLHAILLAPVDLFYNGGIGTYIKASTETHAQVKDRANDEWRVDGNQLRCKVVAEGGNLGATQLGRIEFALKGGRIFTDAIDNSAGVDCSDHEVNVKIWLDVEVNAGLLSNAERNRLLTEMTDDIERLVLRDNTLQTHLLVREEQAQKDAAVVDGYAALIASLELEGAISRELEQLPSAPELARRKLDGRGLTAPELAVVVANLKNRFKRLLANQALTKKPWASALLKPYFPPAMVAARDPLEHPLANAILATVLANEAINRCGPLMIAALAHAHRAADCDVMMAWAEAWVTLNLEPVFAALDRDALNVPRAASVALDARTRSLQMAMMDGVLSVPPEQLRKQGGLTELSRLFGDGKTVRTLGAAIAIDDDHLPASYAEAWQAVEALEAVAAFLFASLSVERPAGMELTQLLKLGMHLRGMTGIAQLERGLKQGAPAGAAQQQLRDHAQQALRRAQHHLLSVLLATSDALGMQAALDSVILTLAKNGYVRTAVADEVRPPLEQTMLEIWTLAEAAGGLAGKA